MCSLPRDKFDVAAIEKLQQAPESEIIECLPGLLQCIQDINWPIAEPALELLMKFPTEITPHVEKVLLEDDGQWKYWCLLKIVPNLPFYSKMVLADVVMKIAEQPSKQDIEEGLDELAKNVLAGFEI